MYKKILTTVVSITVAFGGISIPNVIDAKDINEIMIHAIADSFDDYEYSVLEDNTIEITKYNGTDSQVTIPDTINGKLVTSIGKRAFWLNGSITKVVIPDSVTSIGTSAFNNCSKLETVNLPTNLTTLGNSAFGYTNISEITIPKSLNSVTNPFEGSNLKIVYFETGIERVISNLFSSCTNLEKIDIPDSVTEIDSMAFWCCSNLKEVNLSNNLKTVGSNSFKNCTSLTSINLPESLTTLEIEAFVNAPLSEIVIPKNTENIRNYSVGYLNNFIKIDGFKIKCYAGTAGQTYAKENGFDYEFIDHSEHIYTEVVTKEPTCTETGSKTLTCICGDTKVEYIPATGHNYSTEWTIDQEATCTENGSKSHHCTICGDKADITEIEKTAHIYNSVTVSPTYLEDGYTLHECLICGDSYTDNYKSKLTLPSVTSVKKFSNTDSSIKISWDKLDNVDGYIIYQYDINKKEWYRIAKITTDEADGSKAYTIKKYDSTNKNWVNAEIDMPNIYTISGLESGKSYKFAVKAYKTISEKEVTSPKYPTLTAETKLPAVEFKIKSESKKALLTWNKVETATGYNVYYKKLLSDSWIKLKDTNDLSFTKSDFTKGEIHYFTVKAYIKTDSNFVTGKFQTQKIKIK